MKDIFSEAGIEVTSENKKQLDQAIHKIVDVDYKDCSAAWKAIKSGTAAPEQRREFIKLLKNSLGN